MCEETSFECEWKACLWTFYCGVDFVYITNVKCEIIGKIVFVVVKICLCWLVLGDLLSNAMIIPAGFIKALWNRNIIHNWCLFMVPDTITLLEKFDRIYSGKYSCDRELQFVEPYESYVFNCMFKISSW